MGRGEGGVKEGGEENHTGLTHLIYSSGQARDCLMTAVRGRYYFHVTVEETGGILTK